MDSFLALKDANDDGGHTYQQSASAQSAQLSLKDGVFRSITLSVLPAVAHVIMMTDLSLVQIPAFTISKFELNLSTTKIQEELIYINCKIKF